MIKIFRNIRRRLLRENRFTRYFLYAVGEINLVVIGILIALQINNWNEAEKNRDFEREILFQISQNLEQDKLRLEEIRERYLLALKSAELLISENQRHQTPDSIPFWLGDVIQFERFQPITNSYEALKSEGLQLVRDKELRKNLGLYYDDQVNLTINGLGDVEGAFNLQWLPILENQVVDFKFRHYLIVEDFSRFFNETNAIRLLILNRDNIGASVNHVSEALEKIEDIQDLMRVNLEAGG
ncbi:hypothetical protein E0K83_01645 [Gramella sp. BOM4]|nr:hypothetical protein [Christiangramia bathymodioli]